MKRKYLVFASCIISALLLMFPLRLHADENVEVDAGSSSNSAPYLTSTFWDNYTLLPYIESSSVQYIDTGIKGSDSLITKMQYGNLVLNSNDVAPCLFGSSDGTNKYSVQYAVSNGKIRYNFASSVSEVTYLSDDYNIYNMEFGRIVKLNGVQVHSFNPATFNNGKNIYIYALNSSGSSALNSRYKLYSLSIYDSALNDPDDPDSDEVGYVRYYYPARSKASGIIGLYDAVSGTFVTTGSSTPFDNPTGSDAEMGITANIVQFINNGLGWIGDILEFAIEEPMILMFMAISLCGVAFRWARRVVHF